MKRNRIGYFMVVARPALAQSRKFKRLLAVLKQNGAEVNLKLRNPDGSVSINDPLGPTLWVETEQDAQTIAAKIRRSPRLSGDDLVLWWKFMEEMAELRQKYFKKYGPRFLAVTKGDA